MKLPDNHPAFNDNADAEHAPRLEAAHTPIACVNPAPENDSFYDRAEWAIERGFAVFPLNGKTPAIKLTPEEKRDGAKGGPYRASTDIMQIHDWGYDYPHANVGIATRGLLAVDVDRASRPAGLPQTLTHKTGREDGDGLHIIYSVTDEQASHLKSDNKGKLGEGIDVKTGAGSYIVAPGSVHPVTKERYTVVDDSPIVPVPDWVYQKLTTEHAKPGELTASGNERSLLSQLLRNPPKKMGNRHDWYTTVCGHYAQQYRRQRDLYDTQTALAAERIEPPLPPDDVVKDAADIWLNEQMKVEEEAAEATEESGWLVGNGSTIKVVTHGKGGITELKQFGNFDVRAKRVLKKDDGGRDYEVDLTCLDETHRLTLETSVLSDPRKLKGWLMDRGAVVTKPGSNAAGVGMDWEARIASYLASQGAPVGHLEECLGWNDDVQGYIVPGGAITRDGFTDTAPYMYPPDGPANNKYAYGFEADPARAQEVLREVLTFHVPEVTEMVGSIWAALLVKQNLQKKAQLFPGLALSAPSESGKSEGAVGLLWQLSGLTEKPGRKTVATYRNSLALNRNGFAVIDDPDRPEELNELNRGATGGGTVERYNSDNTTTRVFRLHATPVVIAEGFKFGGQRALLGRFIEIGVPDPTGRKSVKPGREHLSQAEDLNALREEFGDGDGFALWRLSGWFLQHAAELITDGTVDAKIAEVCADQRVTSRKGRYKDRAIVALTGAWLLDVLAVRPDGTAEKAVSAWLERDGELFGGANSAATDLAPAIYRHCERPGAAKTTKERIGVDAMNPVWVERDAYNELKTIWLSPALMADWAKTRGNASTRLENKESIREQLLRIEGAGEQTRKRVQGGDRQVYIPIEGRAAEIMLDLFEGGTPGSETLEED